MYSIESFFKIIKSDVNFVTYKLKKPSILLLQNIYKNWLQFNFVKTHKSLPIYTKKSYCNEDTKLPYGYLIHEIPDYNNAILDHTLDESSPKTQTKLEVNLVVPQQDMMQYFMQWQRYRKFWWSSITTTPSLFAVDEIKNENQAANVNILAQFPWGPHTVESVRILLSDSRAHLSCSLCLEDAMITLLLDSSNNTKDYLRIHRKMAPYKLSYAIDCKEQKNQHTLTELATLLHSKLSSRKISNYLPTFACSFEDQIRENLRLGVTYTAILTEPTLSKGIFHLLNSNTRLKEQVHIADFNSYASLICNK